MPMRSWSWITGRSSSAGVTPNWSRAAAPTRRCGTGRRKRTKCANVFKPWKAIRKRCALSRLKPSAASFRALRNNHHAPHAEEHSCRPSRRALWALLRMRQLCVSKHAGRLYAGHAIVIQLIERALRQFDPVDFDALHALTCREANALLGHQRGNARSPERAGMHINICAARRRNDESKAFLLIEKFDMTISQWAGTLPRSP